MGNPPAHGGGGRYLFDGGSRSEQAQVVAALEASAFDWSVVPGTIVVHIGSVGVSHATPGHVWLDRKLLGSGRFAWPVVQHEFAHQVDFLLLDDRARAILMSELGGRDWCYSVRGLAHGDYGCERFASSLARAYWPGHDAVWPADKHDEASHVTPARFRELMTSLVGVTPKWRAPLAAKAYAPRPPKAPARRR